MRTKLKAIRQAKGWKRQDEIADFFHVSQGTISRWLSGEDTPKGEHWDDINRVYKELFVPIANSIPLPERLIEKFNRLTSDQQVLAIMMFEGAVDAIDKAS